MSASSNGLKMAEITVTLPTGERMPLVEYICDIQTRARASMEGDNGQTTVQRQEVKRYVDQIISRAMNHVAQEAIQRQKVKKHKKVCIAGDHSFPPYPPPSPSQPPHYHHESTRNRRLESSDEEEQNSNSETHKSPWRRLFERLLQKPAWFDRKHNNTHATSTSGSKSDPRRKSDSAIHDEFEFSDDVLGSDDVICLPEVHSDRLMSADSGVVMEMASPQTDRLNGHLSRLRSYFNHLVSCRNK